MEKIIELLKRLWKWILHFFKKHENHVPEQTASIKKHLEQVPDIPYFATKVCKRCKKYFACKSNKNYLACKKYYESKSK